MVMNITRATILTITIIRTTITINHKEKSVMFIIKKVIALINIQTISNKRQKNLKGKTKSFVKIKADKMHFWLIMSLFAKDWDAFVILANTMVGNII